jgi:hypothetical protein
MEQLGFRPDQPLFLDNTLNDIGFYASRLATQGRRRQVIGPQVAFFRGTSLRSVPAGKSKSKDTHYFASTRTTSSTKLSSPLG